MNNNEDKAICPICKNKLTEHSKLQDKICNMIIIKQFANNCPGFDVQFRPFFEKEEGWLLGMIIHIQQGHSACPRHIKRRIMKPTRRS